MYAKLAHLIRRNVDDLSERWSATLADYYPGYHRRDVFRKVRASHLLIVRSLIEKDFSYLFRHLKEEFREWILLKNSFRDLMNLEPVYFMLLREFVNSSELGPEDIDGLLQLLGDIRHSNLRDDLNEVYVGEQEKLFSRQIDELEVLNRVAETDLVGEEKRESEIESSTSRATNPEELLQSALQSAMRVLGATDGVLAFNLNGGHKVVVQFADAPEFDERVYAKRQTIEDAEDQFDPEVLIAFSHVVDRAVLRNYWNPEMIEDLRTQNCPECPYRDDLVTSVRGLIECPILQTLRVSTFFCRQLGANGEKGFFLLSRKVAPAFSSEDMQFIETLSASMMTIINNYQLYEKQRQLATTDGMTGLFNHRYFQDALAREISRSRRYGAPVSLLYMDIDHFKIFNDTYGHQVGDEVLKIVSRTIRRSLRDSDVPCRYGGEELVAILPDTPLEGAAAAAEKIRKSIQALLLPVESKSVRITISVGVAEFPRNARDKQSLIEAADGALYLAKEGGRNQTRVSDTDPDAAKKEEKQGEEAAEPVPETASTSTEGSEMQTAPVKSDGDAEV
jgi:diguanylate cyclase (GGDEF)-like protein